MGRCVFHQAQQLRLPRVGNARNDTLGQFLDVVSRHARSEIHRHDIVLRHAQSFGNRTHQFHDRGIVVVDLTAAARQLAEAIGRSVVYEYGGVMLLRPGVAGFDADGRKDGPVVNLSYWVFEAFPVLATLAPEYDWNGVWREGIVLLQQATAGKSHLPADWLSIRNRMMPRTAEGFDPEFGYNSLRIPLYLLRAGMADMDWLKTLRQRWIVDQEGVATVNVVTGEIKERLTDQGYVALSALLACALDGTKVPDALKAFNPQFYYPASLYLLSMSLIGEKYPQCL